MVQARRYSLQRTMIVYFLLVGFASLLVGVEFVAETNRGDLKNELLVNFEQYAAHQMDQSEVFGPIDHLRNKAVLMIAIILFVMLIVLTMFIKNVTEPLQHMIEVSRSISSGDLGQTITIRDDNELADLGHVINEMASNVQEIIMLSNNVCTSSEAHVARAFEHLRQGPLSESALAAVRDEMAHLKNELKMMRDMVDYFSFYLGDEKHA